MRPNVSRHRTVTSAPLLRARVPPRRLTARAEQVQRIHGQNRQVHDSTYMAKIAPPEHAQSVVNRCAAARTPRAGRGLALRRARVTVESPHVMVGVCCEGQLVNRFAGDGPQLSARGCARECAAGRSRRRRRRPSTRSRAIGPCGNEATAPH
eukprot:229941-Prymnesium_polylepis.1